MAYINLLPPEENKKSLHRFQGLIGVLVLIYIIVLLSVYLTNYYQTKQLKFDKTSLENQLKMVEKSLEKVSELGKENKILEDRLRESQSLAEEDYILPVIVFMSSVIPEEMLLSRFTYSDENISFFGETSYYHSIANFMVNLKASEYFSEVELISSFTNNQSGSIGFKINARLNNHQ
ncbi:MAG: PilN domain-containing protein [Halanaerobiales bacterium]|nr:PilN domain-containing protein [Halanaerobiales bacterium]